MCQISRQKWKKSIKNGGNEEERSHMLFLDNFNSIISILLYGINYIVCTTTFALTFRIDIVAQYLLSCGDISIYLEKFIHNE